MSEVAESPCWRCGSFAALSAFWGRMLCTDCVGRASHVLAKSTTAGSLFAASRELFSQAGVPVLLVSALTSLPFAAAELVGVEDRLLTWLGNVIDAFVGAACVHVIVHRTVLGGRVDFTRGFGEVGRRFGSVWWSSFLSWITGVLFMVLLVVPGVMRLLSYAVTTPIVLFEAVDGSDSLEVSTRRMEGHRKAAFWAYACVGAIVFAVACLPFLAYVVLPEATADEFPNLDRVLTACSSLLGSTALGLRHFVTSALYLKVSPPETWRVRDLGEHSRQANS